MKHTILIFWLALAATQFFTYSSCKSDTPDGEATKDSLSIDTGSVVLPPPPPNREIDSIGLRQAEKSHFKDIGCCADKEKRKTDDSCCYAKIVEEYAKMKAKKDKKLFAITTADPIFGECKNKKKWKLMIDKIDNPPPPIGKKEKEPEY